MYKIIDGSMGEGGGSLVRLSFALACLTQKPIHIKNIRANRPNPGLRTQHLVGIKTLQNIFGGELSHAEVGSTEITYKPQTLTPELNEVDIRIGTAGSIALVIQILRLALVNIEHSITLNFIGGATFGTGAPSIDYLINVTEPTLRLWGYSSKINILQHGFYPKGGAKVRFTIFPKNSEISFQKITNLLTWQNITKIIGISVATEHLQKAKVADRQRKAALEILGPTFSKIPIEIKTLYVPALSPGSGLTLWTEHKSPTSPIGACVIGQRGFPSEKLGKTAAHELLNHYNSYAVVDEYLADQILSYAALHAPFSFSTSAISSHTKTNIAVIEEFLSVKFSYQTENMKKIINVEKV
ncbi:MAG: RNA 3'-terminal phosphate cyclase [Candidatus Thorarchaeota archaeon]